MYPYKKIPSAIKKNKVPLYGLAYKDFIHIALWKRKLQSSM
jgi:hypothetical protein